MRSKKKAWSWLGSDPGRADRLMDDLSAFLCSVAGHATACVVHRPGYQARYAHYRQQRWQLCKSAYTILVERAAKIAAREKRRLAVYVEMTGRDEDDAVRAYHAALRETGMFFDAGRSEKYRPLGAEDFSEVLLKKPNFFDKGHLLGQVADLLLYPLVKGRYDASYRPHQELMRASRIIDCTLPFEQRASLGVKYFCFDSV